MRKSVYFFLAMMLSGLTSFPQVYRGSDAGLRVPGAVEIRVRDHYRAPDYIRLDAQSFFSYDKLDDWMKSTLQTGASVSSFLRFTQKGLPGELHYRMQQAWNGVPVFDGRFIVHTKDGLVSSLNGSVYRDIQPANLVLLTEAQALVFALQQYPSERYKWEMPEEEALLKSRTNNPEATRYPEGKLVLYPVKDGEAVVHHYTWMFNVYSDKPLKRDDLYIDAQSGELLFSNNRLQIADVPGTAVTAYSGNREIVTDSYNEGFRLRESGRGNGVETYNMQQGTNYGNAVDFTDADNYWDNVNAQQDEVATDAHWGAEMTYDYFWINHNRNSIDDQGFKLISYIHYDEGYANAFWDGEVMTYGDGNSTWSPLTTVDICAHEITHGLTTFTADLIYAYEPGALNESYSDIFGASVEFYAKPNDANWTIGEDMGGTIRDMADPNAFGDPDTYLGDNWYTGSGDNGGVHTNSGVLNHWYYLLSEGGTGVNDIGNAYSVTGIGVEDAGKIAFRTLTVHMENDYQYADARFYSIVSAAEIFGACSPQYESTVNAFYAVGVGDAYNPTVVADFDALTTTFCSLPANVQFTNTTINGSSYTWDFGDGTTGNQIAPAHTYTSEGTYTVTLYADGDACGADTLVIADFIVIDSPDAPVVASASNCGGPASLTLTASAPDSVRWYTSPVGGTHFHTGTSFTTPVLNQSEHYYVSNEIVYPESYGGKPDNSGGGGYFTSNNPHYLEFNVFDTIYIKSVKVYAGSDGNRLITLVNSNGQTLASANVYIEEGESRVDLNFTVFPGNGYELTGPGSPDLYRNNNGCNYPYVIGSMATITGSSASSNPTGYYYYFYDWEVTKPPCVSERLKVSAFINYGDPVADFTATAFPLTVVFQNASTDANEFSWDFGDGSTSSEENPVHVYAAPGLYTVNLTVTNSCGTAGTTQSVNVMATGLDDPDPAKGFSVSPIPARGSLQLHFTGTTLEQAEVILYDLPGKAMLKKGIGDAFTDQSVQLDVTGMEPGVYLMEVRHAAGRFTRTVVLY